VSDCETGATRNVEAKTRGFHNELVGPDQTGDRQALPRLYVLDLVDVATGHLVQRPAACQIRTVTAANAVRDVWQVLDLNLGFDTTSALSLSLKCRGFRR
jgi:hypothetical protein